ncbi:hypothetical protein QOT17_020904 [Balamuthia mandrillaris]
MLRYADCGSNDSWEDLPLPSPTGLTKFGGGRPFLPVGEQWPKCEGCGVPLRFVFQLHMRDLPPSVKQGEEEDDFLQQALGDRLHRDDLLLQCFYCNNDSTDCDIDTLRWVSAPLRPAMPSLKWRAAEAALKLHQPSSPSEGEEGETLTISSWIHALLLPQELTEFISEVKHTLSSYQRTATPEGLLPAYNEDTLVGWSRCEEQPDNEDYYARKRLASLGRELTPEEKSLPCAAGLACTFKLGGWMEVPFPEDHGSTGPCCEEFVCFLDILRLHLIDSDAYPFMGRCTKHDTLGIVFV